MRGSHAGREPGSEPESEAAPGACAGILPHAGWHFSGRLALEVLSVLCRGIDTMVIIGGHMGPADRIVAAFEDAYETPLGELKADLRLLEAVRSAVDVEEDRQQDNTVEIHLPLVRYLAPGLMVLGMRAPPSSAAQSLGTAIAEVAAAAGRRVAVAGSTDLTHYGSNYGFSPAGRGEEGLRWVRDVNDRRIVDSMVSLEVEEALERARRERSACSVGGAAAAMSFARASGARAGTLVGYMTSRDVQASESFVGYAGILYRPQASRPVPAGPT
jgi:MEMO1 family protein